MQIELQASSCTVTSRGRYVDVTLDDVDEKDICNATDLVTKSEYDELKSSLEDEIAALTDRIDDLEKRLIEP